jgi:histidinol-phosphate aminotransferase
MSEAILKLARPDIVALRAYEYAAWEADMVRLHANELPWRMENDHSEAGLNRYPEPQAPVLLQRLAELYRVDTSQVLIGRGSDELIDLLVRAFCRAGEDRVLICPPTFGMYAVSARIQDAEVIQVPLSASRGFDLDEPAILERCTAGTKLIFICSPNNPTGNSLDEASILRIAQRSATHALTIVDEAYVEFSTRDSLSRYLAEFPQLVILRTLSKAYGLAGARCGALLAHPVIVQLLRKIIPPYAITQHTIESVSQALQPLQTAKYQQYVITLQKERERLGTTLEKYRSVTRVWPSDCNFLLVEFADASRALQSARTARLLIRDVRSQPGLENALRITIGTKEQNDRLLEVLQ